MTGTNGHSNGTTNGKAKIGRPRGSYKLTGDQCLRAARFVDDGWTIAETAAHFSVSPSTITSLLKRLDAGGPA